MQAECFLSAGFYLTGAGRARPGHRAYRLSGPDGWLLTVLQTHADVWQIAVQYGATAAAPNDSVPKQAGCEARGQAGRVGGVVWLDDPAGALAFAWRAALLVLSGPQVRE